MKTLSDLHTAIATSGVGSLTLTLAANGKALVSGTFPPTLDSQHQWGDSISDALTKLFAPADVSDDEDLL